MLLALVMAINGLFGQGLPGPQPAPVINNTIVVQAPPPDSHAIADASVESSKAIMLTVVSPPLVQFATDLCGLPDVWRSTPPGLTYGHADVGQVNGTIALAASGLIGLAIFSQGLGRALGEPVHFGRLFLALVLSFFSLTWCRMAIDANNALSASVGANDPCAAARPILETHLDASTAVATTILVIVYAAVLLLLLFSLLFRLGLIDVLISIAPLALMLGATPQSAPWAALWWRLFLGFVFSQVMVAIGLRVAGALGTVAGGVTGELLAIVVLLVVRQIPGLLATGRLGHGPEAFGLGLIVGGARRVLGFLR